MIVGADVTHPGNGPNKTIPSMAGVVATNGPESTTYLASARLQDNNTEVGSYSFTRSKNKLIIIKLSSSSRDYRG